MLTRELSFTLKDGRSAILRNPQEKDVPGLLEYLVKSAGESEFILRSPEECGKYTPESEVKWVENMNASENSAVLVCEANIGIALTKEFWGLGIGTAMFNELIRIAEGWDGLTQMELEFVEGNTRARALYEKMGFRIVSVRPDAFKMKDGGFRNEYIMMRKL